MRGKPKRIWVKIVCPCERVIRVKIMNEGKYLQTWEVACQKHQGEHVKVILGHVHATGSPTSPEQAQRTIQAVVNQRSQILLRDQPPFTHRASFGATP